MGILITVLTILDVLIAVLIIALVLVQQSKSTGLGTTFGGGGSDSLFGAHAATHLSKLTVVFTSLFLVITLSLAILSSHQSKFRDSMSDINPLLAAAPAASSETPATVDASASTPAQAEAAKPAAEPAPVKTTANEAKTASEPVAVETQTAAKADK